MAMIEDGMNIVTVKKSELLEALKKNRESHNASFLEARMGYRAEVVATLQAMLDDAKAGKEYRTQVHLEEPKDHTKEYDRIIRMLTMSVNEEIKISDTQFCQYVLDEWGWKSHFIGMVQSYSGKVR